MTENFTIAGPPIEITRTFLTGGQLSLIFWVLLAIGLAIASWGIYIYLKRRKSGI